MNNLLIITVTLILVLSFLHLDDGDTFTIENDCRILLQEQSPLMKGLPSTVKVCIWKDTDQLRYLLVGNNQPNVLIVAHGQEIDKWYLQGTNDSIPVDDLPLYYNGGIGVYACRTWDATDNNLVWETGDVMPYEGNYRVVMFTTPMHTLYGNHIEGAKQMAQYFK